MFDKNFYRAFEDRYRGSRELIKSRLSIYLPFILPLQELYKNGQNIDLGCGRGEWLELLQEKNIGIQGVDLDSDMLEAAHALGLKAIHGDAIQYLKSLASESIVVVTGFHLAEHLPFEVLQVLVQESLRVLKPGGMMILETPNPENIVVGTSSFYLDPTHQRPIPSELLSFVMEHSGFERVKILRLQEAISLTDNAPPTLLNVFNGVSPDYAVVAQKGGSADALAATDIAFKAEFGLSLESIANMYDQQTKIKSAESYQADIKAHQDNIKDLHASIQAQQKIINEFEARTAAAESRSHELQTELTAILAANHLHWTLAEERNKEIQFLRQAFEIQAQENLEQIFRLSDAYEQNIQAITQCHEQNIQAIRQSISWRITAPIRYATTTLLNISHNAGRNCTSIIVRLLAHAKLYINRRPKLRRISLAVIALFPSLKNSLRKAAIMAPQPETQTAHIAYTELPPRTQLIYSNLKVNIENIRKGDC